MKALLDPLKLGRVPIHLLCFSSPCHCCSLFLLPVYDSTHSICPLIFTEPLIFHYSNCDRLNYILYSLNFHLLCNSIHPFVIAARWVEGFFLPLALVTMAIGVLVDMMQADVERACAAVMALLHSCHTIGKKKCPRSLISSQIKERLI